MNLNNKTFKDNRTGEVLKVIDSFENIAILENKTKIDTRRLMDPNHFTEQVDPASFFNTQNAYDSLFEKIKTIPADRIPDDNGEVRPNVSIDNNYRPPVEEDSAIIYGSIDDEKEELARKYGVSTDNTQSFARQNEAFARILEDSPEIDELPKAPEPKRIVSEELPIQRVEIDRDALETRPRAAEPTIKEDPIYTMFRGVKRSVEFSLDLKLENKIPRLDFIEMMEDSYEKSIIDFLAEEFANELLKNPNSLKESIKSKIKEMVYSKTTRKPATRKPAAKRPVSTKEKQNSLAEKKPIAKRQSAKRKIADLPIATEEISKKQTEKQ